MLHRPARRRASYVKSAAMINGARFGAKFFSRSRARTTDVSWRTRAMIRADSPLGQRPARARRPDLRLNAPTYSFGSTSFSKISSGVRPSMLQFEPCRSRKRS